MFKLKAGFFVEGQRKRDLVKINLDPRRIQSVIFLIRNGTLKLIVLSSNKNGKKLNPQMQIALQDA